MILNDKKWDMGCIILDRPLQPREKIDVFFNQYRFTMHYVKLYVKGIKQGYQEDKYMEHKLTLSGAYLRSTLSDARIQKVLKLLSMIDTGPEVFVATMITVLYNSYAYLVETLNHMKGLKLKYHTWDNVKDCCDAVLLDADRLESAGAFNHKYLGYIIHIFEDTSDYRLYILATKKYKEDMDFIKKLFVCDEYVIRTDDIIAYNPPFK